MCAAVSKNNEHSCSSEKELKEKYAKAITISNTNPNILRMELAVLGPLARRAAELSKELKQGVKKPFTRIIAANLGDGQAMGQPPITFIRQMMALVVCPLLLDSPKFPDDVKERARTFLSGCKNGSAGSYTDSPGIEIVRRHVADYIKKRDGGIPSDWENIFLGSGASDCIVTVLKLFNCPVNGKKPGVIIPIPQFPLYSATIALYGMYEIGYNLEESKNWGLNIKELERLIKESSTECHPRVLVVINPGNPTGQVLTRNNIEDIIKFAYKNTLFIFADEVYQENVYADGSKFYSFKKVMTEMGAPFNKVHLASFMSCSKGYMAECGIRSGYVELVNMSAEVKAMYIKLISASLCPNSVGQACLNAIVCPPEPGEPSYELWSKERTEILQSLKARAKLVADSFNSMDGFECQVVQGAMYAFPRINLPDKAIQAAKAQGTPPDVMYAFELLESTGISIVAGSGFGQQPGTYHFRTTILPPTDVLKDMMAKFAEFHRSFIKKYS